MKFITAFRLAEESFVKNGDDLFKEELKKVFEDKKPIWEVNVFFSFMLILLGLTISLWFWFNIGHNSFEHVTNGNMLPVFISMFIGVAPFLMSMILIHLIKQPDMDAVFTLIHNRKKFLEDKFMSLNVSDDLIVLFKKVYNVSIDEKMLNKTVLAYALSKISDDDYKNINKLCNKL